VQVLVEKSLFWKAEDDDQDFEITSDHFLTGLGNGAPSTYDGDGMLELDSPVRHDTDSIGVTNCDFCNDEVRIRQVQRVELVF